MFSYLRSVPNKFIPFVNARKQVTNIDHQLSKHVKSSLFLEGLLDVQTTTNIRINSKEKTLNFIVPLSSQNVPVVFTDTNEERPKVLSKTYNKTKHRKMKLQQLGLVNIHSSNVTNCNVINMSILKSDTECEKSLTSFKDKDFNSLCIEVKNTFSDTSLNSKEEGILYTEVTPDVQKQDPSKPDLEAVYNILSQDLPLLFVQSMNYSIYTSDLIFVNNIKGTTTVGIHHYVKQMALLKIIGHLKFAYIKLEILKMTMHPEDSSIKVRWRINGISGTYVFLTFWKYKFWNSKDYFKNAQTWYDGFSTFYVNNDNKIYKHVVDKMIPDQEVQEKVKTPVESKLALFAVLSDLSSHYFHKLCANRHFQLFRIK